MRLFEKDLIKPRFGKAGRVFYLAAVSLMCFAQHTFAGIDVAKSNPISPDQKWQVQIIEDRNDPDWDFKRVDVWMVNIKNKAKKRLFQTGGQFSPSANKSDPWTRIIWRQDSKAFALSAPEAKGAVGLEIFCFSGKDWHTCKIEDTAEAAAKYQNADRSKVGEKGHDIALSWDRAGALDVYVWWRGLNDENLVRIKIHEDRGNYTGLILSVDPQTIGRLDEKLGLTSYSERPKATAC